MHRTDPRQTTRRSRVASPLVWLAAAGAAIALSLVAASSAEGGTYRAVQCDPGLGAGHGDLSFARNSDHYASEASCQDGRGLTVRHTARHTGSGKWGAWTLDVPDGAALQRARAKVSGTAAAGHTPELLIGVAGASLRPFGNVTGKAHAVRWRGDEAERIQARLRCRRSSGCGEGNSARVALRRLKLRLLDSTAPEPELGGPIAAGSTQRGTRVLQGAATDDGGGVRRLFVEVNDRPSLTKKSDCAVAQEIALRLSPCPNSVQAGFGVDTTAPAFHQGPNRLRVCAIDYSPTTDRNRGCTAQKVRVDNECPVDSGTPGGRVEARIATAHPRRPIAYGKRARVAGRLIDADGEPVADAEVCVATRVELPEFAEHVVATPETDRDGRFEARLPAGANREVRIAHWPDSEHVDERYLDIGVRARPRLTLHPKRTLHNGDSLQFAVRLPGPVPGDRRVHLKVRDGSRWRLVDTGRTNNRGRWRTSYRFQATTGAHTYRFRAVAPRQPGYPYAAGRSVVRKARVVG
jgi:5-hydroxyisourate hydrolase-like protein (transthyretin family)